jgi:NitT/TauT family transport system ATP-binding protein
VIESPLPDDTPRWDMRDTQAFMDLAHAVREALADGHHE